MNVKTNSWLPWLADTTNCIFFSPRLDCKPQEQYKYKNIDWIPSVHRSTTHTFCLIPSNPICSDLTRSMDCMVGWLHSAKRSLEHID
jgi:hypothetical protein